jgi:hypothetical protein
MKMQRQRCTDHSQKEKIPAAEAELGVGGLGASLIA